MTEMHTSEYAEILIKKLHREGIAPDDLTFRFTCQHCGLRCCLKPSIYEVHFHPYTFAFIRQRLSEKQLQELFDLNLLCWSHGSGSDLPYLETPYLKPWGFTCPFLLLWWDSMTRPTNKFGSWETFFEMATDPRRINPDQRRLEEFIHVEEIH